MASGTTLSLRPLMIVTGVGRSEEVDEQLVDALGLVVVDPVRRVGQALDAVEVGDVLVVGLGETGRGSDPSGPR